MQALTGMRDFARAKSNVQIACYKGERVAAMVPTDVPYQKALGEVAVDMLQRCGFNVETRETDLGMVLQHCTSRVPVEHGGWSAFCTTFTGLDMGSPATSLPLRGNEADAWFGWPKAPRIEALRDGWFAASDLAVRKRIAAQIQVQAFTDVPIYRLVYLPIDGSAKVSGRLPSGSADLLGLAASLSMGADPHGLEGPPTTSVWLPSRSTSPPPLRWSPPRRPADTALAASDADRAAQ
jgi:hypothetical protein